MNISTKLMSVTTNLEVVDDMVKDRLLAKPRGG